MRWAEGGKKWPSLHETAGCHHVRRSTLICHTCRTCRPQVDDLASSSSAVTSKHSGKPCFRWGKQGGAGEGMRVGGRAERNLA